MNNSLVALSNEEMLNIQGGMWGKVIKEFFKAIGLLGAASTVHDGPQEVRNGWNAAGSSTEYSWSY